MSMLKMSEVGDWISSLAAVDSSGKFGEVFVPRGCKSHHDAWVECLGPEHIDVLIDALRKLIKGLPKKIRPVKLFGTGERGVDLSNSDVSVSKHLGELLDVVLPALPGDGGSDEPRATVRDLVRAIFVWHATATQNSFDLAVRETNTTLGDLATTLFTQLDLAYETGEHNNRVTAQTLAYKTLRRLKHPMACNWDERRRRYAYSPSLRVLENWKLQEKHDLLNFGAATRIAALNTLMIHAATVATGLAGLKLPDEGDRKELEDANKVIRDCVSGILDELRNSKLEAKDVASLLQGHSASPDPERNRAVLAAILASNCLVAGRQSLKADDEGFLLELIRSVQPENNGLVDALERIESQTNQRLQRTLSRKVGSRTRLSAVQDASIALLDSGMWNDAGIKYPRCVPLVGGSNVRTLPNEDLGLEPGQNPFAIAHVTGTGATQRRREREAREDALRLAIAIEWFGAASAIRAREVLERPLLQSINGLRATGFVNGEFECETNQILERNNLNYFRIIRRRVFMEASALVMHQPKSENDLLAIEVAGRFFIREQVISFCDHKIPTRDTRAGIGHQVARICNPFRDLPRKDNHRYSLDVKDTIFGDLVAVERAYLSHLHGGDEEKLVPVEYERGEDGNIAVRRFGVLAFHELLGRFLRVIPPSGVEQEAEPDVDLNSEV